MKVLYVDASAILRILFSEPGPRTPLKHGIVALSSRLVEVETSRAVDRARLGGYLDDRDTAMKHKELGGMLAGLHLVSVSDDVIRLACMTFPIGVRALDAIHVATAQLILGEVGSLEFWTHDQRQAEAALARGIDVCGVTKE
jgi:predicted nucleic acid-binding protein